MSCLVPKKWPPIRILALFLLAAPACKSEDGSAGNSAVSDSGTTGAPSSEVTPSVTEAPGGGSSSDGSSPAEDADAGGAVPEEPAGAGEEGEVQVGGGASLAVQLSGGGNSVQVSRFGRILSGAAWTSRRYPGAALLSSGALFISGGESHTLFGHQYFTSSECLSLDTGEAGACPAIQMPYSLSSHRIVGLANGKALLLGGHTVGDFSPRPALLYDPLGNGGQGAIADALKSGESGCTATFQTEATQLKTLKLTSSQGIQFVAILGDPINGVWLFNETTGCFTFHDYTWALSQAVAMETTADGRLFLWQGNHSAILDPGTGVVTAIMDPPASGAVRKNAGLVLLANGKIAVLGGVDGSDTYLNTILLYSPPDDTWTTAGVTLLHGRAGVQATRHSSGKVILFGGVSAADSPNEGTEVDLWDPGTETLVTSSKLSLAGVMPYVTDQILGLSSSARIQGPAGQLGWVGGGNNGGSSSYVLYQPGLAPTVFLDVPWEMGRTYTVEVLAGEGTGGAASFSPSVSLPLKEQANVQIRVTGSDGTQGTVSFSVSLVD